jgi:branched-chain amino acid transport system permease protein
MTTNELLIQLLILGVCLGGVYALMASGLTLIFGVMRIVNLSHAILMMIASYVTYFAFQLYGLDPILSLVLTMPIMYVVGMVVYKIFFSKLSKDARYGELTVLLTFSIALIFEGLLGYFFTNIYRTVSPTYATSAFIIGNIIIPKGQFYATVLSIILIFLLWAFLRYTRTGNAIRATMQNTTAAQVVGINIEKASLIAFGLGTMLGGAAGSLDAFLFPFYPARHWEWIAILLSLIVLGGMGSLIGALVGAMLLAVSSVYVSQFFGPTWSPVTFFLALFLILLFRPQGLFGKKMEVK